MDTPCLAERLVAAICPLGSAAVALSGGVDSAVTAAAAVRALGDRAVAVTADSPSVARVDLADAIRVAAHIGIRHVVVETREFDSPAYAANDGTRCYHCKSELYDRVFALRESLGVAWVLSGANRDDLADYRPGLRAAAERGVRHPLVEAGLGKTEVRAVARHWGLPVADKPASPCLSSRIAPGVPATAERVARVEAAEAHLREAGFSDCRVRVHEGELARVEVPAGEIGRWFEGGRREGLTAALRGLGFRFVTLDLDGLRSGSLNELIPLGVRPRST